MRAKLGEPAQRLAEAREPLGPEEVAELPLGGACRLLMGDEKFEAVIGEVDTSRAPVASLNIATDQGVRFELVERLLHGLLGEAGPLGELGLGDAMGRHEGQQRGRSAGPDVGMAGKCCVKDGMPLCGGIAEQSAECGAGCVVKHLDRDWRV